MDFPVCVCVSVSVYAYVCVRVYGLLINIKFSKVYVCGLCAALHLLVHHTVSRATENGIHTAQF